jgi:hypothetical protein
MYSNCVTRTRDYLISSDLLPTAERPANDSVFGILPAEVVSLPLVLDTPGDSSSSDDSQDDRQLRLKPILAYVGYGGLFPFDVKWCSIVFHPTTIIPVSHGRNFASNEAGPCALWSLDISFSWTAAPSAYSSSTATICDDEDAALSVMRLLLPHASRWRSFSASVANYSAFLSIVQSIAHLSTALRLLPLQLVDLDASCLP